MVGGVNWFDELPDYFFIFKLMVAGPVVFLAGVSPSPLLSSVGMDGAGEQVQDFMAPLYCIRCLSFLYLALAVWVGQRRDV